MARSQREDVEHVVLRLLLLLHHRSAGESPESHGEEGFFLFVYWYFKESLSERLAGMVLKTQTNRPGQRLPEARVVLFTSVAQQLLVLLVRFFLDLNRTEKKKEYNFFNSLVSLELTTI